MAGEAGPAADPLAPVPAVADGGASMCVAADRRPPVHRWTGAGGGVDASCSSAGSRAVHLRLFPDAAAARVRLPRSSERPRLGAARARPKSPSAWARIRRCRFAPASLSVLRPGKDGAPPLLAVHFMGLLGPNGPLPLHLTEYVRDRMRNVDDPDHVAVPRPVPPPHADALLPGVGQRRSRRSVAIDRRPTAFSMYIAALSGLAARVAAQPRRVPRQRQAVLLGPAGGADAACRRAGGHHRRVLRHAQPR